MVLEKLDRAGGNTALSTGSIPAAGSRLQREAGVEDSVDRMVADLLRQSGPHEAESLTRRLSETSAALVDWLVDTHAVDLSLITDYKHVGHSVTRLHARRRGAAATSSPVCSAACERAGVDVLVGNPVTRLVVEDGRVSGVVVAGDRVEEYTLSCNAVVLASNGFAANKALIEEWIPELSSVEYFGAHGSTGEGLEWDWAWAATCRTPRPSRGTPPCPTPTDRCCRGPPSRRAQSSSTPRAAGWATRSSATPGSLPRCSGERSVVRHLRHAIKAIALKEEEYAELVEMGGAREFDTIDEMAAAIGVDAAALAATIVDYNAAATGDAPDVHRRTDFGLAPLTSPFVASRVTPGLFHTQGGLAVDDDGRVLRPGGDVVPGLYAVGGVAAGVSGKEGGRGYSSGNGLLAAIGLGRLAGIAARQEGTP